jgi:3-methyladenine DNA glycosylase AlkC
MENEKAFKNWINPEVVKKIGTLFHSVYPKFNEERFFKKAQQLKDLELKARVLLLTEGLANELTGNFKIDKKILKDVLVQKKLKSFELWPISEYISQFGLDHFDESFDLMYHLTQEFTSEFAIRPFLKANPDLVLKKLSNWINDKNVHVRRWISEGTRPILPWGGKIPSFIQNPATIKLLDALKYDEEMYVRKSVANHLNDISKDHPSLVIKTLKNWLKNAPEDQKEKINWIKKHALRTLIKKGNISALELMGVLSEVNVKIIKFKLNKKSFKIGDPLQFEFGLELFEKKAHKLIIDYGIGFRKSNGSISTKVFKLKTISVPANGKIFLKKAHSLKKVTNLTFYPGIHELMVQVNGKILKKTIWELE